MTYPKPLSEKTLRKKYEEAHISGDVREFLHHFFAACANLYGTVDINEIWEIYQELKDDFPRIHKTDLVRFSAIARREKNPYYIYEVEELYPEDYDFSIVFDTVENRKIRHEMNRKYTDKIIKDTNENS